MTAVHFNSAVPTISQYTWDNLVAAKNAGEANLLSITRKQHSDMSLYVPFFIYSGQKFRMFFDPKSMKQNFERCEK